MLWGLVYWRPKPLAGLPKVKVECIPNDPNLPDFPEFDLQELVGLVHAADLHTQKSIIRLVTLLCNIAVAWKSGLMSMVAASSTEAKFLSAVMCTKMIKCFCHLLNKLDLLQDRLVSAHTSTMK